MDLEETHKVPGGTWKRYLFYIDLVVFAVFAVALILLVRHTFIAGQLREAENLRLSTRAMWLIVGDTAFLVGALGWIVYRFFRNQYLVLTRRF